MHLEKKKKKIKSNNFYLPPSPLSKNRNVSETEREVLTPLASSTVGSSLSKIESTVARS